MGGDPEAVRSLSEEDRQDTPEGRGQDARETIGGGRQAEQLLCGEGGEDCG